MSPGAPITPITLQASASLHRVIEQHAEALEARSRALLGCHSQKMTKAAHISFHVNHNRPILSDESTGLTQNVTWGGTDAALRQGSSKEAKPTAFLCAAAGVDTRHRGSQEDVSRCKSGQGIDCFTDGTGRPWIYGQKAALSEGANQTSRHSDISATQGEMLIT